MSDTASIDETRVGEQPEHSPARRRAEVGVGRGQPRGLRDLASGHGFPAMSGGVTGHADAAAVRVTVGLLVQHREEAEAQRVELDAELLPDLPAQPGDVITTGTPPGVGMGMKPPLFLKKGDVMTLGIEGLGEQRQEVVPFKLWAFSAARGPVRRPSRPGAGPTR